MFNDNPRYTVPAFAAVVLGVAALVLGYWSFRDRSPIQTASIEKLTIASAALPHPALLQIAQANGYFAEEGLDPTVVPVTHGKLAIDLLLQGKVDLATAAEVPFVLQVLAGRPLAIAANLASTSSENVVIARRDRNILSPQDLIKRKMGVTFGTSGDYFLWAYLIRNKLPPESVKLVDLPPGQLVEELAKGTVDAISTFQPFVLNAQSVLGENGVSLTGANAYTELHVVVSRSDFLKEHPKVIEKFVRALLKAERFNRSEPEKALNLVATRLKMDARALRPIWNEFKFEVNLQQSQINTLEDEASWAMARGYAEKGPVPNFLPHFYLDALLAAQPDRVTVVH